ncbi:phosphodiesterase [Vibrio panuliri]|uniref:Phosphodiesterase n=2 Tax=Vibrio panuliri TaxID=1381081 RepID=A0ABX3FPL9_9VIBR|nr:phosphodiesterase [Vibrio panuliri]
MCKKTVKLRLKSCLIVSALFCSSVPAEQWQSNNVLVLHSYAPSYQWTADMQSGIEQAILDSQSNITLSIEYLDTKRILDKQYFKHFERYFDAKYRDYHFDAVLITDDGALSLINQWQDNPLKGLPMVAGGINNPLASLDSVTDKSHIIFEQDQIAKTLELIANVRPNMKTLYYVSDRSTTSEFIRQQVKQELKGSRQLQLREIRDLPLDEALNQLTHISSQDAVLLTHYNTEILNNQYYSYNYLAHQFSSHSAAPVFVLWKFYISQGVFGGYVQNSSEIGAQMIAALGEFMSFPTGGEIQRGEINKPMVDYLAMQRFGVGAHLLPDNTQYLNEPQSYFKQNWHLLSAGFAIFLIMMLVIVTQAEMIRQKRKINKQNKRIVGLHKRTLQTQKDMIVVLGEAIESRSGETGNHVKRVAKVSYLLGKLYGLSHRELELIEVVSPMHDVGKIVIPEHILDKPAQLDEDEREIMKTHTIHGHKLLSASKGDVFRLSALIALQHHEHWDGNGYPHGIAERDIHIFSRITAVADVFDALLSVRCYKKAWPLEDVIALFQRERGKQFDPNLTDLLIDNMQQFIDIRNMYPDNENRHSNT